MTWKPSTLFISLAVGSMLGLLIAGCSTTAPPSSPPPDSPPVVKIKPEPQPPVPKVRAEEPRNETRPEIKPFIHTVRWPGETLSLVAKWYTGRHANWKKVAKANPHLNPHRIFMGNEILIPPTILTTQKTMPRSFVTNVSPKKKAMTEKPKTEQRESETPPLPLFGPKGG